MRGADFLSRIPASRRLALWGGLGAGALTLSLVAEADGEIVGVWTHSLAIGRHDEHPAPDLLVPGTATDAEVTAALDRYRRFITG